MLWLTCLMSPLALAEGGAIVGEVSVSVAAASGSAQPKQDRSKVVVYLTGFQEPPPLVVATMSQKDKTFVPDVLPIVKDQVVSFENMDPLLHNVFSSAKAKSFDLGKYGKGSAKTVTFPTTGVVDVYCDIHESMIATVLVLPNRAFAVTGADGRFRIEGVKPGEYTLFAWQRRGAPARVDKVRVEEGGATRVPLSLVETVRDDTHLDKYGKPYRKRGGGYEKGR